jgi:hypothetical protein
MTKFNYNEPEFKVVKALSEDVITTSLGQVSDDWDTHGKGNTPDSGMIYDGLFTM